MSDKEFYDNELAVLDSSRFETNFKPYVDRWLPGVRDRFAGRDDVRVLDLGAGSCTASLIISREPWVKTIVAADISGPRMDQLVKQTIENVPGDLSKISFAEVNFNDPLPFGDDAFDLVFMDASLHHSRNIWFTLEEIRRVLVPEGLFVAQREAYTSPLTHWITFSRLLKSPEVAAGVSENAYLKSQYDYYLRANGFTPRFDAVHTRAAHRLLPFANGLLFSKYNIVASSTKTAPRAAA